MMESQQIQKTKQSIDQRRQKLQLIKTRLQKKLQNKSIKAQLQQKSSNSKTLINHLNTNSNLFQQNKSSQFYQSNDITKFASPDKTFQFNSTLFKHLDKNQSQNKSKYQNNSSQFFRDNGDINSYLRVNQRENQMYNYSQKKESPRKDKYLEKEPEHDSIQVNPTSLNLFSQYDKFLQQINTNAKLPVKQIKKHLQKKQSHLNQDHSNINIKGLSSTHNMASKGFTGFENFNENNTSLTSLNQDQINNFITNNNRNNSKLNNNKPIETTKPGCNQNNKGKQLTKKEKQTDRFKKEEKQRFLEDPFGQSTLSLKIHKKNQSSQTYFKPILPPHPDKSSRTQLNSDRKHAFTQRQLIQNSGESVDIHKERLKLMLSEKKKNYQSCDKLEMDDSIQYDLSSDEEQIQQKKKQLQYQKSKKIQKLLEQKENLKKQLKQIDDELEMLQSEI